MDVGAHLQPPDGEVDPLSREDIQTLVQGIRDAAGADPEVILPPRNEAEETRDEGTEYGGSCYWDASSMAPLNAASAVRTTSRGSVQLGHRLCARDLSPSPSSSELTGHAGRHCSAEGV